METAGFIDIDQAIEMVRSAINAINNLRDDRAFWKIAGDVLLSLGHELGTMNRAVYGVHVHRARGDRHP